MIDRDSVMVTLSPRLLLEIDLTAPDPEPPWIVREDLPERKFAEFRKRCIENSFKEIIFSDERILLDWLASEEMADTDCGIEGPSQKPRMCPAIRASHQLRTNRIRAGSKGI